MSIISTMQAVRRHGDIPGTCPHCKREVYESLMLLDDAYNVWCGKCPHCGAHSFLGLNSLRGYSRAGMTLWLPTDEERDSNELPKDTPTRGATGRPANFHGTQAGEIYRRLSKGETL